LKPETILSADLAFRKHTKLQEVRFSFIKYTFYLVKRQSQRLPLEKWVSLVEKSGSQPYWRVDHFSSSRARVFFFWLVQRVVQPGCEKSISPAA